MKISYNGSENGAYIYQGNNIIVPEDTPDSEIHKEVSCKLIEAELGVLQKLDDYFVPPLDGREGIRFITLGEGGLPPGWKAVPMRQALIACTGGAIADGHGPVGRILRSCHVSIWRGASRFCGSCGAPNKDADTGELARQCTVCGKLQFPQISPAVIFIVINDKGEALLAHNMKFAQRVYSLIAGFNEAGESLEDTIVREAKEEVNVEVKDIQYIRSQPWPFPNSLMLGFTARYKSGELRPDGVEIEDAKWFSRDELPELPGSASISRYLIELWRQRKL